MIFVVSFTCLTLHQSATEETLSIPTQRPSLWVLEITWNHALGSYGER